MTPEELAAEGSRMLGGSALWTRRVDGKTEVLVQVTGIASFIGDETEERRIHKWQNLRASIQRTVDQR